MIKHGPLPSRSEIFGTELVDSATLIRTWIQTMTDLLLNGFGFEVHMNFALLAFWYIFHEDSGSKFVYATK